MFCETLSSTSHVTLTSLLPSSVLIRDPRLFSRTICSALPCPAQLLRASLPVMEHKPSYPPVPNETYSFTTRITREGKNLKYELRVLQQPLRARACGSGQKCMFASICDRLLPQLTTRKRLPTADLLTRHQSFSSRCWR
jgi:hypothetical protein